MCITKPPKPQAAPPPPNPKDATLAAVSEQRAQAGRASAADNILTRLSKEEVAASALKKKLGE